MNRAQQLIKLVEAISGIWDKSNKGKSPRINKKGIPRCWYWLQTVTKEDDNDDDLSDIGDTGDFGDGGGGE